MLLDGDDVELWNFYSKRSLLFDVDVETVFYKF